MRRLGTITVVSLLSLGLAGQAAAQVAGIPYYVNPRGGTGITAAANWGSLSSDAGDGTGLALTGGIGAGPLFLTGTAGRFSPDGGEDITTFGATAGMKVFGNPLVPVALGLQVGAGYFSEGSGATEFKQLNIPVALGIGLNMPLFPLKPWIAPRVQFVRSTLAGTTANETRMGFSVGADFNLLLGLGFHAAFDHVLEKDTSPAVSTFGLGAHFNFRVPMM